jgi:hypothetical protein
MPLKRVDPFYDDVPVFTQFSGVIDIDNYRALPDDWWLATGDIVNSTGAIAAGDYKSVNMAGAALISAVLNALGHRDLPFVFGGDGALVALPAEGHDKARQALAALRTWAREGMGLEMRAAMVPMRDVRAAGLDVRVARFRVSDHASFAMFAGGGASWAEARMKDNHYAVEPAPSGAAPDLEGLSCRWSPIPARHGAIVSIIAVPGPADDMPAFARLVEKIVAITGGEERAGHPVPAEGPEPKASGSGILIEGRAGPKAGKIKRFFKAVAATVFAFSLIRWNISVGLRRWPQDDGGHRRRPSRRDRDAVARRRRQGNLSLWRQQAGFGADDLFRADRARAGPHPFHRRRGGRIRPRRRASEGVGAHALTI